jgi:hypothetical protein
LALDYSFSTNKGVKGVKTILGLKTDWELKNFRSDSRLIKEKNIETFNYIENFIFYSADFGFLDPLKKV